MSQLRYEIGLWSPYQLILIASAKGKCKIPCGKMQYSDLRGESGGMGGMHRANRVSGFLSIRPNWVPPYPLTRKRVFLLFSLGPRGRHSPLRGRGWGTQFRRRDRHSALYSMSNPSTGGCMGQKRLVKIQHPKFDIRFAEEVPRMIHGRSIMTEKRKY